MELVIFCLILSGLVMKQTGSDVAFLASRGKTPPSHELRMAKMRAAESKAARRQGIRDSRSSRSRPFLEYAAGTYRHAWGKAATKRQIRWAAKDPVKADRYAKKIERRADKLRQRHADKDRGVKVGLGRKVAGAKEGTDAWLRRNKFKPEPGDAAGPLPPHYYNDGDQAETKPEPDPVKPTDSDEPEGDKKEDPTPAADETPAAPEKPTADNDEKSAAPKDTPEPRPSTAPVIAPVMASVHPIRKTAQEESTDVSDGSTGEMTGATDAMAQTENWINYLKELNGKFETAQASLSQNEVGQATIAAYGEAGQGLDSMIASLEKAKEGIRHSTNVGESYSANPEAGKKEFAQA